MEYPKINSLFKRREDDHTLILGDYSCEEFGIIKLWRVEEKIDGTNIRVEYNPLAEDGVKIQFYGRSKGSLIQENMLEFLKQHFTYDLLYSVFQDTKKVTLYGEGYGGNIQAAGKFYRKEVGFMLFDILIDRWWFTRKDMHEKAAELGLPVPPEIGIMSVDDIFAFVESHPKSLCTENSYEMEGIIARTEPLLLFRNGKPLMWKLKVKDI